MPTPYSCTVSSTFIWRMILPSHAEWHPTPQCFQRENRQWSVSCTKIILGSCRKDSGVKRLCCPSRGHVQYGGYTYCSQLFMILFQEIQWHLLGLHKNQSWMWYTSIWAKYYTHYIKVNKYFLKGLSKDKKIFLQQPNNRITGPVLFICILSSNYGSPNRLSIAALFSSTWYLFLQPKLLLFASVPFSPIIPNIENYMIPKLLKYKTYQVSS